MLLLNCPHCGPRNVSEFRHGGEVNPRPSDPALVDDRAWADYLYMRRNELGLQTEWWYHRQGCGRWFLAERHTLTNVVQRTWLWQPGGALPAGQGEAPASDAPREPASAEQTTHPAGSPPPAAPVPDDLRSAGRSAGSLTFTFDGRPYTALPGDTIASALARAGVKVLGRSFKYHRPRGLLCCAGHCPNCLVQVGDEPNVRACRRPVEAGLQVRPENAWPSLGLDVMSLSRFGSRFLPVGFYYKAFIRPKFLWPLFEAVLRRAAGLGAVHADPRGAAYAEHRAKEYLHADVAVVGGGPAGLAAALAAAEQGARVLLLDENDELGGHLRYTGEADEALAGLLSAVRAQPRIEVRTGATVLGWFQDHWLPAVQGDRLLKIRAAAVVAAPGLIEQPLIFADNDLPGIMLGSGVQRLLRLHGVAPGKRAVVVAANDDGWAVAADLNAAGVQIAAIADEREPGECRSPHRAALEAATTVLWGHTITAARGGSQVRAAHLAPLSGAGQSPRRFNCDLIVLGVGWAPILDLVHQAGGLVAYDEASAEYRASRLPPGLFLAGRAAGAHALAAELAGARLAGADAAAHAGLGAAPDEAARARCAALLAAEPRRSSALVSAPGGGRGQRLVCLCEDVTPKDIETSVLEGYDSLELLKRYSTVTMGPCQGKLCALSSAHLCARATGQTLAETGTTTSRQPFTPVALAALAGQHMEPVQVTPVHAWHTARGATWMLAGLWKRPLHYGDPVAEVRAVRERVGLIDVSTLGKLRFTGPGARALLDRIYATAMGGLRAGRVRYGVMCSDEGVVLDDGVAARLGADEWYVTTTTSGASAMFESIQWWMQSGWGGEVHLTDLSEAYAAFNLAGPRSRLVLQALTPADLSNAAFPYMHVREIAVAGVPCRVLRIGFTGELSYEIHVPAAFGLHVWEALVAAGEPHGLLPFGVEAQRVLRLEKGHLIISQDTDALSDPLGAGLGWAVKLDKPDFLGKRSLTRLAADGPAQKLTGFVLETPRLVPEEGLQIVRRAAGGKWDIIGQVTSCRHSPTLDRVIGLCWLAADLAARDGASFTIRLLDGAGFAQARVHHGPFHDPRGERLRS
jgi:sarcosine oxidase subunit alpha